MKVFVIDSHSAGGLDIDRFVEMSTFCLQRYQCSPPTWGFRGFGTVTNPSDAVFVEAPVSHHVLDRL